MEEKPQAVSCVFYYKDGQVVVIIEDLNENQAAEHNEDELKPTG